MEGLQAASASLAEAVAKAGPILTETVTNVNLGPNRSDLSDRGDMIQISQNAANQIHKMLAKNGLEGGGLRIGVKAGGCSGYEYVFAWEKGARPSDQVFTGPEGAQIFVDAKSYTLLEGTELDYDTSLMSRGFMFSNPNAKSTCGCGSSFTA
jgi:iron-sulfur cluster assembly protein